MLQTEWAGTLGRTIHSGRVLRYLRKEIIAGNLPNGQHIVESAVAKQFSVSRGPVRNALLALEKEGLVRRLPNGHAVVVGFTTKDMEDLYRTRCYLEVYALEHVLERCDVSEVVRELSETVAIMENEIGSGCSTEHLAALDIEYHRRLVGLSNNRPLFNAWMSLAPVIETVMTITHANVDDIDAVVLRRHRQLIRLIEAGERDEALRELSQQAEYAIELMRRRLAPQKETPAP